MSLESLSENSCRLCAEEKVEMFQIFGDEGKQRKVAQKLRVCLPVMVYKTDPLPKKICQFCAARLDDVFEFREYCLNVYRKMHVKLLARKHMNSVKIFLDAMANSPDPCQAQLCMLKPRAPPPLVPLPTSLPLPSPIHPESIRESLDSLEPLSDLPCEVQIKEELSRSTKAEAMSVDDDDECLDENLEDNCQGNDSIGSDGVETNGTESDPKGEKKTSILEQVLTGNLTINDCKELSPTTKLSSKWWCSPCNNYYRSKESLVKHITLHCPRKYSCGKCTLVFPTVEDLAKHEGSDHLKVTLDFEESVKQCHCCDREFVSWEMLKHHRLRDHLASSIELGTDTWCSLCNRFFPNIELYQGHAQLHESGNLLEKILEPPEEIDNSSKAQEELESLKREHFIRSIRSLTCPTCGKVCTQQSALSNHMRTHEPKKHKCEECGRSFGLLIRLETHKMSEHNQKNRISPALTSVEQEEALNAEREAREAREAKLRSRPYREIIDPDGVALDDQPPAKRQATNPSKNVARCGICEQWFTDHTTMLNHLQTHSDNLTAKNFTCTVCRKSFKEKWQLQRHEVSHKRVKNSSPEEEPQDKVHIVDKTFHCQKCNKIFFKEFSLVTHQCMNQKRFKCPKCLTFFGTWQARASHMRLHSPSAKTPLQKEPVDDPVDPTVEVPSDISSGTALPLLEPKVEIKEVENASAPVKRTLIRTANGYRCGVCQSPFVLRELAVAHLRSAHPRITQYTFSHHIKTDHPNESEK
ncbi:zinc finger protein 665-like isoform X1 [Diachasmimorpha longicaudata]|uniref:zinc finger protein 665-like isoform X1 n=2 Tax=Diachasmimorpha longicaudata TaxID=58733 RepID=UPI0030B8D313